jgi:hypothetical protein
MQSLPSTANAPRPPLTLYPAQLAEQSIKQLAELPAYQLVEANDNLNQLIDWSTQIRAKLDAAIELRVGNAARQALRTTESPSSEVQFDDGELRVHFSQAVEIQWDQTRLRQFANRIAESGDQVENFLDIQFSVDEARFQRWGPSLQALVARARIEVQCTPRFALTLVPAEELQAEPASNAKSEVA